MPIKFSSKRQLTDQEEAEIQKGIASDPDSPEITDEQIAKAMPFAEAFPDMAENIKRSRGRPKLDNPTKPVTFRLDPDVLKRLKAKGPDWRRYVADLIARNV